MNPEANRLIHEKSPYLIQHAYNPVDWYPWGEEAFKEADIQDKPIFLSIGYSTCHWCHVMEHESFSNPKIGELMNEAFINIKVDREERPDVDGVYMAVSQMLTGGGGWPLTIIMTPDGKPFYSATYVPRETTSNVMGMVDLIPVITDYWANQRKRLTAISENVAESLNKKTFTEGSMVTEEILGKGYRVLMNQYDEENGRFSDAPKFPAPHNLLFLLRYWKMTGEEKALQMVEKTLKEMAKGGIFDHLGYGFHRYSTDSKWLVPHFEKMLYDQALLLMAYTEAYQATGNMDYRVTAERIITYVLRDLSSQEGGFYSAEDADSEGEEGKFYIWTAGNLQKIVGDEGVDVLQYYGVKPEGNYQDEVLKRRTGGNILHITEEKAPGNLEEVKRKLLKEREKRIRPQLDDKILTDWNGLMIAALSKAARAFRVKSYAEAASRSQMLILNKMWNGDTLLHRLREGEADINGFLNDYAFTVMGLIELYQATHVKKHLDTAYRINAAMMEKFMDPMGGFFFTANEAEKLLTRRKDLFDGAIPSGNSVAYMNLMKLSRLTGDTSLTEDAASLLNHFSASIHGAPHAYSMLLSGLTYGFGKGKEVVVSGKNAETVIHELDKRYLPNMVVHRYSDELASSVYYLKGMAPDNTTKVFVCTGFKCSMPTDYLEKMWEYIEDD